MISKARLAKRTRRQTGSLPSSRASEYSPYASFEVQNFRSLAHVRLGPLRRVNLVAGENNSGKTALLEALFLHCGAYNPSLVFSISGLRGVTTERIEFGRPIEPSWGSLFGGLDESSDIRLVGTDRQGRSHRVALTTTVRRSDLNRIASSLEEKGESSHGAAASNSRRHVLKLSYDCYGRRGETILYVARDEFKTFPPVVPVPPAPARFLSARWAPDFKEVAELFGELEVENKQELLLQPLRKIEPRLTRLTVILLGGKPMLHADVGLRKLVPLAYMGDGVLRLAKLILQIIRTEGGTLIVDEVENGFHYSVLEQVWSVIAKATETFRVQLFAATHSRECIVAAHKAFSQTFDYDFSLHRLEKAATGVESIAYDQEALEGAIASGFEVR